MLVLKTLEEVKESLLEVGTEFLEEGVTWKVAGHKEFVPEDYLKNFFFVIYYDVKAHPQGLALNDCEYTPLDELAGYVLRQLSTCFFCCHRVVSLSFIS